MIKFRMMNFMFYLQLFSLFLAVSCQDLIVSKFSKDVLCDVGDQVDRGCSTKVPRSHSLVHCTSLCGRDKSCIGASLDDNGACFHHRECPFIFGCSVETRDHLYMTKFCVHGTWDASTHSCQCVDGFYGEKCHQCYTSCGGLLQNGYPKGAYTIYIDPEQNGKPFRVTCYINPSTNYANVLLLVNSGMADFNKTWVEYVNGFQIDEEHRWAGLHTWHRLSKAGYNAVTMVFEFVSLPDAPVVYRSRFGFVMLGEETGYSFTFTSTTSNERGPVPPGSHFGDCLGPLTNVPFSTWDDDRDGDTSKNCAARAGSGWWYTGCDNPCNALGFGLQYLDTKPRHQVVSLVGVDMNSIAPGPFVYTMYVTDP